MEDSNLAIDQAPADAPGYGHWPFYDGDELAAVARVLHSGRVNYWTGEEGKHFESEFARYCGVEHGVALSSGSVALEVALYALGIGPGDEVVVTPRTFIATASSIVLRGATPVFAEVAPDSQNITAETIAAQLSPRTRAILVVHYSGWPCEMPPILDLAGKNGLKVIEDCAQAHGATFAGRPVGSFGDAAVFSFCQDKIISTGGEGGMLVTRDPEVWRRAWSYKDHGKNYMAMRDPDAGSSDLLFRWVHDDIGSNLRMTEMQAAIGRVQLRKLDRWIEARRSNAALLAELLIPLSALHIPAIGADIGHAWYKFHAFVRPEALKPDWDRSRIIHAINAEGAPCYGGGCSEVYREKAFTDRGLAPRERFPVARKLGETSLVFPVHPTLSRAAIEYTASTVEKVLSAATL